MATSSGAGRGGLRPIEQVGVELGLLPGEIEPHGRFAAKVGREAAARLAARPAGKLVLITAITPTPAGEGKTTTAVGLTDGLRRVGARAALTLRQPSLGPIFGMKGGGGGGGRAQVAPPEVMNLHLTGDLHAVAAAHNLGAALIDNHLARGNALELHPATIRWPRTVDVNDRVLRHVRLGMGGKEDGPERDGEFIITAASEVMASLALASDLHDLRRRLGRTVIARRNGGAPVTLDDLKAAGAMTALLTDAVKPNLMQTLEGSPVLIHAGPFGNVAHGNSSIIADQLALRLADVVVTEAGFAADLGGEKFFDIKCRVGGLRPAAAVLVASVRALRAHGGGAPGVADPEAVRRGCANLVHHLGILRTFGVPAVVALNAFPDDGEEERRVAREAALEAGARAFAVSSHFADGGAGAVALAHEVLAAAAEGAPGFRFLYGDEAPLRAKVEAIATRVYGADGVDWEGRSTEELAELEALGFGRLPVCMAKTHLSVSHDPRLGATPKGFRLPVREVRLAAGAGFVTVLNGAIRLMPGLPTRPVGGGDRHRRGRADRGVAVRG
jgi:formate--tetrahydrofolate ligase